MSEKTAVIMIIAPSVVVGVIWIVEEDNVCLGVAIDFDNVPIFQEQSAMHVISHRS